MPKTFEVGAIFTRCFIQKGFEVRSDVVIYPLPPTSSKGEIRNAQTLLEHAGLSVTREFVDRAIGNFKETGHSVCVKFSSIHAASPEEAMSLVRVEAQSIAGALAFLSANPVVLICMFAKSDS